MEPQEKTPTATKLTIEGMLKILTLILLVKVTYEGIKNINNNLKTTPCLNETDLKQPQLNKTPVT